VLEFNPPLRASYPERVYVAFDSFYIYGQRWPDIWSHNSQNWFFTSSMYRRYAYINLPSAVVVRDYWAYSVWPESYRAYNDTAPYIRAVAYVTITTQAGATSATPYFPRISYAYIPTDGYAYTQLKYVCLATETGARGLPSSAMLYVARGNANAMLDTAVSMGGAVVSAIGNAMTATQLLLAVFGLPTGGLLTAAGFITWGLGVFIQMVSSNQGSCGPSGYLGQYYTAASYDFIRSAALEVGIGQIPDVPTGDFKQYVSLYVRDSYASTLLVYPGNGILTNFFTYVVFGTSSYFSGPAEPYGGIGWVRYYIPVS
jgi:hypothetical protein